MSPMSSRSSSAMTSGRSGDGIPGPVEVFLRRPSRIRKPGEQVPGTRSPWHSAPHGLRGGSRRSECSQEGRSPVTPGVDAVTAEMAAAVGVDPSTLTVEADEEKVTIN